MLLGCFFAKSVHNDGFVKCIKIRKSTHLHAENMLVKYHPSSKTTFRVACYSFLQSFFFAKYVPLLCIRTHEPTFPDEQLYMLVNICIYSFIALSE